MPPKVKTSYCIGHKVERTVCPVCKGKGRVRNSLFKMFDGSKKPCPRCKKMKYIKLEIIND